MAKHLAVAERQQLQVDAYELSLQGHSFRAIAQQLGVSHPTIAQLVRDEGEVRRKQVGNRLQRTVDMQLSAINRLWQELDKDPSPHSVANLMHALRGLIQDMAKLSGITPPDQVRHQHNVEVSVFLQRALVSWCERLNPEEVALLELLTDKAEGGLIAEDVDVVELAFKRYRKHGTLTIEAD